MPVVNVPNFNLSSLLTVDITVASYLPVESAIIYYKYYFRFGRSKFVQVSICAIIDVKFKTIKSIMRAPLHSF